MRDNFGDLDQLRQVVFQYMLSHETGKVEMAKKIGVAHQTLDRFMDHKRIRFTSLCKIINFFKNRDKDLNVDWDKEGVS